MNEPGKIMLLFLVAIMFTVQAVAQNLSVDSSRTVPPERELSEQM